MSGWNMPDGCTQADHDRYYDDTYRTGEPDDDTVRCDCGHWDSESRAEDIGTDLICHDCARLETSDPQAYMDLRARIAAMPRVLVTICPECREPIMDGAVAGHKCGCTEAMNEF